MRFNVFLVAFFFSFFPILALGQATEQSFTIEQIIGTPPTSPPSAPENVSAVPIAPTQIDLSWDISLHTAPVIGYQISRDGVAIATTSQTNFSDIGLQASTTYSYSIRAFDGFGNISSSTVPVVATTYPLQQIIEGSQRPTIQSGRAPVPEVLSFTIEPGTSNAHISFSTSVPTRYTIRYGETIEFELSTVETERFQVEHSTILTGLSPNTVYEYEVVIYDRYQQEVVIQRSQFTTQTQYLSETLPNVSTLKAVSSGSDVFLTWNNPTTLDSFAYVRVVRNHRFFPRDPNDGYIVYEGLKTSVFDLQALKTHSKQFYTIFVLDLLGNTSSGAVTSVEKLSSKQVDIATDLSQIRPPLVPATTQLSSLELRFSDLIFLQEGFQTSAVVDNLEIDAQLPFLLRVPAALLPQHLKVITVTITRPTGLSAYDVYLLRRNESGSYYEALLDPLVRPGNHTVVLSIYDLLDEIQYQVSGSITAKIDIIHISTKKPEQWYVVLGYWFFGFIFLALLFLWLWRLLILLNRVRAVNE